MALVSCAECNAPVSDSAGSCPKCGAPISKAPQAPIPVAGTREPLVRPSASTAQATGMPGSDLTQEGAIRAIRSGSKAALHAMHLAVIVVSLSLGILVVGLIALTRGLEVAGVIRGAGGNQGAALATDLIVMLGKCMLFMGGAGLVCSAIGAVMAGKAAAKGRSAMLALDTTGHMDPHLPDWKFWLMMWK